MNSFPKFSKDELEVKKTVNWLKRYTFEMLNTPITSKENMLRIYQGKTPMWLPSPAEWNSFKLECDPETIARSPRGGKDGYGVEWTWVDVAGGATVKPGNPICPDINEWEKYVTVPNPDEWDWKGCIDEIKDQFDPDRFTHASFGSCLFERLIAILDCSEALIALVDEDQQEGVHRFFRAVTNYRKRYYELCKQWMDCDLLNFNDDWGTAKAPFFSFDTAEEMLMPYVKESVERAHEIGCFVELHCCGKVEPLVPHFITEGIDSWGGQPLNDKPKLKRMYGDKLLFTHEIELDPNADEFEVRAAVQKFMEEFGYDNRGFNGMRDLRFNRELYIASRKNFDRMVEEGTAIL